ncbi:hypothetical protein [Candidatus Nitrososphaera sp. FF02]|uniref:hypothetical protein n=1 Tax=Candidatus Nitrososphaera sp. FF02 TaxID=3398226 RepID=UPI0039EABEF9
MEIKKETKYKVKPTSEVERDIEDAGDKIKAGAKAAANKVEDAARDAGDKMKDASRDFDYEYRKEKAKEKLD